MNALSTRPAFGKAVGTRFRIGAVPGLGGPAEIVLRTVDDRRTAEGWECFSMLFDGTNAQAFPQGSYPVVHDDLGEMELFLVPLAEREGLRTYEAVVYRPLPAGPVSQ